MIETLMKNDNTCNIVKLKCPMFVLQGMTNNVRSVFGVVDTTRPICNFY